jgi:dTDP-4-dehydrorhamnose 3,5-epimerase
MSRFEVEETPIEGVRVLTRSRRGDERGYLERLFDAHEIAPLLDGGLVNQVNRTVTRSAGTVRGLHLQLPPHADMKLVSCLQGSVFDVAVDLRCASPTFLKWYGCELSESNGRALFIPEGCAHGIQTLENDCQVLYLHTSAYSPESEAGLNPRIPAVGIAWPLPISSISERDSAEQTQPEFFKGVNW